jgi:hypothetical protein
MFSALSRGMENMLEASEKSSSKVLDVFSLPPVCKEGAAGCI